jgi:hypothetical protein
MRRIHGRLLFLLFALGFALLLSSASALAYDGQAKVDYGYGQFAPGNSGGEFDITTIGWTVTPSAVPPLNPAHTFSTFCVQQNQFFSPGGTYNVEFAMSTNHTQNVLLNAATAKLFKLWNHQQLVGFDWAPNAARGAADKDVQQVLWRLMYDQAVLQGLVVPFAGIQNARQLAWYNLVKGNTDWTGLERIRVMRLYGTGTAAEDHQDMLVELAPEPASLALLAIGGLPVLPLLRRRRSS